MDCIQAVILGGIIGVVLSILYAYIEDEDVKEATEEEPTILDSLEECAIECSPGHKLYVSPEIWWQWRKRNRLRFIPIPENGYPVVYYYGCKIEEDINEPMFRAEKE